MASTTIGQKAKNYEFDITGLDLKSLMQSDYSSIKFSAEDRQGHQTLTLKENSSNYIQLYGDFNENKLWGGNVVKIVQQVTTLTVVEGGKVSYTISGLDLTGADLTGAKTLAAYLEGESYKIQGNATNDTITTSDQADRLYGNDGNDTLSGMGGKDRIYGGNGVDKLLGGDSSDVLDGGKGNDRLTGGAGVDTFVFVKGSGSDTISDFDADGVVHDVLDLSDYAGINRFGDLDITRARHDVVITLNGHDEIVLKNVDITDVNKADFHF